jgi:hypothetical protein
MNEKLKTVIHLLHEIDDEIGNEICLRLSCLDGDPEIPVTELSFWGMADLIIDYMQRREKNNV